MRRQVLLGGESRQRSLTYRGRVRPEFAALGVYLGAAAAVAFFTGGALGYTAGLITFAVISGVGLLLFLPRAALGGSPPIAVGARRARWRLRQRRGLHAFVPGEPAHRKGDAARKTTSGPRVVPDWVGTVRPVQVKARADDDDPALVLLHSGLGSGLGYATIALEVSAGAGDSDQEYQAFGRFKAILAQDDSLVGGIQQWERVMPASLVRHEQWLNRVVPDGGQVPQLLLDSYEGLVERAAAVGEQHHSVLVLRIPFTNQFQQAVRDTYEKVTIATRAQTVLLEAQRAAGLAMTYAGYKAVTPLSEPAFAARIAASFDDSVDLDSREYTLSNCWPEYEATAHRVKVSCGDGRAVYQRTARINGVDLPARPIEVDRFRPLIVGVYPAVTRTLSVVEELLPAWVARQQALEDQTVDRSRRKRKSGQVTDGSEADQESASQQRLDDLGQGHGHQGDSFGFYLTVQARSEVELSRSCQRIEGVANEFTKLTWLNEEQDLSMVTTVPLGRGILMKPRKGLLL